MEKVCPTPLPGSSCRHGTASVEQGHLACRAGHHADLLVTQRTTRVVLDDRHVDPGVGWDLEVGRVHPLSGARILDEVGDPRRCGADP